MELLKQIAKSKTIWMAIIGIVIKFATPMLSEHSINVPDGLVELIFGGAIVNQRVSNKVISLKRK